MQDHASAGRPGRRRCVRDSTTHAMSRVAAALQGAGQGSALVANAVSHFRKSVLIRKASEVLHEQAAPSS